MLKILIIDDDEQVRSAIELLIDPQRGYKVVASADDLESALQSIKDGKPDVAFVDIHLARRTSGYAVAAKLKSLGIACVLITGAAVPPFAMPELALACIQKPFSGAALNAALQRAIELVRGQKFTAPQPNLKNLYLYPRC